MLVEFCSVTVYVQDSYVCVVAFMHVSVCKYVRMMLLEQVCVRYEKVANEYIRLHFGSVLLQVPSL